VPKQPLKIFQNTFWFDLILFSKQINVQSETLKSSYRRGILSSFRLMQNRQKFFFSKT